MASDSSSLNGSKFTDSTAPGLTEVTLNTPASEVGHRPEVTAHQGDRFFVVGIGASAGGLRALEDFFAHVSQNSGAAFVVIQHLSPDYKSLMRELLGRCTSLPVHQAKEGMMLTANAIYLIPPGQNLTVKNGQLHLTERKRTKGHHLNFPIDLFLNSLAKEYASRAIAIILSGTGSDGSRGLQDVHKSGGITLVQEPSTAEFDGMPHSAITTGMVDRSMPPAELAQLVSQLVSDPEDLQAFQKAAPFVHVRNTQLQEILQLLAVHEDIDFSQYKTGTLIRRIQRRCFVNGFQDLNRYITKLRNSVEERQALRSDLLISVTRFFRDPHVWQHLQNEVLPPLVDAMSAEDPVRIWVTACATGEEAYTIAILIDELARSRNKKVHAKIFATDLAHQCIEHASRGIYSEIITDDVSESRLERYFIHLGDSYEVSRSLREMIVFAPHNLLKDAGFSRIHLVTCRNMLIYLEPVLQQQVIRGLHFSLQPKGLLLLGESENLGELEDEFTVRDPYIKLYEKRRNVRLAQVSLFGNVPKPLVNSKSLSTGSVPPKVTGRNDTRVPEAFRLLLAEREACCLIVDESGQTLHVFGATPEILPPPSGPVSNEAIKMVAPPLQLPLSAAFSRAYKNQGVVHYKAINLAPNHEGLVVNLQVAFRPADQQNSAFFVVIIQPEQSAPSIVEELDTEDIGQATAQRIFDLETELQRTREHLQATIEELETTNEEQQATNEELIASNEELQSTNEELQSLNEELYTVNAEYQSKIQELLELNNDIDNLLYSTDIGVIFLDRELRVRKFTPAAVPVFALVSNDVGRPIYHLAHNLDLTNLQQHLQEALATEQPIEYEVKLLSADQYLLMRINPYRVDRQRVDGLVLTFVDITAMQHAQIALEEKNALLQTVIDSTPDRIYVKDTSGRYQFVNKTVLQLFDLPLESVVGANDVELQVFPEATARKFVEEDREILEAHTSATFEESLRTSRGEEVHHLTTKTIFYDKRGNPLGLVVFARDVTQLKETQARLQQINDDLYKEMAHRQAVLVALQESEDRFRSTFEQAAVGIAHVAPEGTLLRLNQRFASIVGYTREELLGKTFQEITHPEDLEIDLGNVNRVLAGDDAAYTMAKRYLHKNGGIIWAELTVALVRNSEGEPTYFIAVIQDISAQKEWQTERELILQELAKEKELAQVTLHCIGDAVITTDAEARVQYCNPVAEELTGWSTQAAQGQLIQDIVTLLEEETRQPAIHPVETVLAEPRAVSAAENLVLVSRSGREFTVSKSASPIRDRRGKLLGVVAVFRDVTEARLLSRQLTWQASHDPLTGLINRRQFEKELIHAIAIARMDESQEHVLCYLDLDQFKVVNDTCGHLAGDELLRQVAVLLKTRVRGSDCLARLGGDEFGVLLQNCPLSRAEIIADNLRESIQAFRFVWENRTFRIGVSIGLVTVDSSIIDLPSAMSAADAACYAAKERGRNRLYIYQSDDADMTRQRTEREWSVRIRNALERDQFCLYYQTIVPTQQSFDTNRLHYEVLLRMVDIGDDLVPPNAFIPAAERYNLMPQIDRWVVQRFFSHVADQNVSEAIPVMYTVNLSGASLTDDSFLTFLRLELQNHPGMAEKICFEITETVAISNLSKAVKFITEIQKLGCKFALDDFGSGMSSFGYLKTLPINYIKIDGKFVHDIVSDPTARAILESINRIGHVMGLETIAECVEDDITRSCLKEIGVDYVQGYGIAYPQPL